MRQDIDASSTIVAENRLATVEVTREFVLTKCAYFTDIQVWPLYTKIHPERWLLNFSNEELRFAVHLLNAFLYFSQVLVDQLFASAFQRLSIDMHRGGDTPQDIRGAWRQFCDTVLITRVTGEEPNDTDSGFHFLRMARQVLGIPEARILGPRETLSELLTHGSRPVVFVDDFAGSGNQFIATWRREILVDRSTVMSFNRLASSIMRDVSFYYCPVVATELAEANIKSSCPSVRLSPAHFLSLRYSALSKDSLIWPPQLRDMGIAFLEEASARAGIPSGKWKGFEGLGLALAFEHGVPDATLPLFHWDKGGWRPLIERR